MRTAAEREVGSEHHCDGDQSSRADAAGESTLEPRYLRLTDTRALGHPSLREAACCRPRRNRAPISSMSTLGASSCRFHRPEVVRLGDWPSTDCDHGPSQQVAIGDGLSRAYPQIAITRRDSAGGRRPLCGVDVGVGVIWAEVGSGRGVGVHLGAEFGIRDSRADEASSGDGSPSELICGITSRPISSSFDTSDTPRTATIV